MTERKETVHNAKMISVPSCWPPSFPVQKGIQNMFTVKTQCRKWLRCSPSRQRGTPVWSFQTLFWMALSCRHASRVVVVTPKNKLEIWVWGNPSISSLESIQSGLCGFKTALTTFLQKQGLDGQHQDYQSKTVLSRAVVLNLPNVAIF